MRKKWKTGGLSNYPSFGSSSGYLKTHLWIISFQHITHYISTSNHLSYLNVTLS
ncbi:hypothetical protein Scep_030067 [Stephania cephalantha]|uniref:Uncharacterized protein n=1 Tax=Stephania cephalantha TaxID=152367 RepID=A0AAP0HGJ2_9MAGN